MNLSNWRAHFVLAFGALLIDLAAVANGNNNSTSHVRATTIVADIKAHGSKATVVALWANIDQWNEVIANIGRGRPEWLQVAIGLHPGSDADSSEMLDEAVFLALKPAPIAVLRLIKDQQFSVTSVCGSKFWN